MKKIIYGILCVIILSVMPSHTSNTSKRVLTVNEITALNNNLRRTTLSSQIEEEYELFYENLDNTNSALFVGEFFNKIMCSAIESRALPSVSMAQASLETGYGKHNKLKNNIFGIKGRGITTKTREFYNGRFITIHANFQYFPTIKDAFNRHYQILNRYGVYGNKYQHWIERIVACGYATDPNYDKKLNYIIEKYQLYRLDKIQKLTNLYAKVGEERNLDYCFTYIPT